MDNTNKRSYVITKDYCNDCGTLEHLCICNEPQFYETKKRKIRKQLVGVRKVRRPDVELPDYVRAAFKGLSIEDRIEYFKRLYKLGWTLRNIGKASGISREYVRRLIDSNRYKDFNPDVVDSLPTPEKPVRLVKVFKHVPIVPDEITVQKLKELHDKAKLIRGPGVLYRDEAEQFGAMLNDLINQGYSSYQISKALGLTHAAINHRLVRYGYKQSNGKSKVYRKLTHRLEK